MTIPVGVKGRIRNVGVKEPYILVEDDQNNTGGYYIYMSDDATRPYGYDAWVLPHELNGFFQARSWDIEWFKDDDTLPADVPKLS